MSVHEFSSNIKTNLLSLDRGQPQIEPALVRTISDTRLHLERKKESCSNGGKSKVTSQYFTLLIMSQRSFAFTPTALRSLEQDQDLLERQWHQRKLREPTLTGYFLRKEARDRAIHSKKIPKEPPPLVCTDLIIQNALFTGDLETIKQFFPKGSPAKLVIRPEGGAMRWVSDGEVRGKFEHCV